MKRLHQLLPAELLATVPAEHHDLPIGQLAYDSRAVGPTALFAAWRGARADGHAHLGEAQRRGASFALVQRPLGPEHAGLLHAVCRDPRRALAHAARHFYDAPAAKMALVAITGTNGKTTAAHLMASVLAAWRGAAAALGTLGTSLYAGSGPPRSLGEAEGAHLTTPEAPALAAALASLVADGCTAAALEASSIALDQGRLDALTFDVAAWSNFTQDHLDYHGDMQRYFRAKQRLFAERLKPQGVAVFNADDPAQAGLEAGRALRFSRRGPVGANGRTAEVYLVGQTADRKRQTLEVQTPRGRLVLRSTLLGDFNGENILLVVAAAEALAIPHAAVVAGVGALAGVPGRLEPVLAAEASAKAPLVLVDYAHTPDALGRVLTAARGLTPGRLWCVFGCGGDRDPGKRPQMGAAVAAHADLSVVTNDNPRSEPPAQIAAAIQAGLAAAGATPRANVAALAACGAAGPNRGHSFSVQLDRSAAIREAVGRAALDDTVVVAGKGHETVQIVGTRHLPFDDRAHARRALAVWPEV